MSSAVAINPSTKVSKSNVTRKPFDWCIQQYLRTATFLSVQASFLNEKQCFSDCNSLSSADNKTKLENSASDSYKTNSRMWYERFFARNWISNRQSGNWTYWDQKAQKSRSLDSKIPKNASQLLKYARKYDEGKRFIIASTVHNYY